MCRVTLRPLGPAAVIEVDGALDIVGGHDLRRVFAEALRSTDGTLFLDLSRVTAGRTRPGVAALTGCSEQAISARVLMWSACRAAPSYATSAPEGGSHPPSGEREPTPTDRRRDLGVPASRSRENA